jgi:hypothetical protein
MRKPAGVLFWKLLLLLIFLTGFSFLFSSAAEQPRITFKETVKSFSKVKEGTKLHHEFVFTNTGNAPLLIKRVTTSCGCTAALVSEEKILPGKEGRISVQFDTRGYFGQVTKQIYVESNDPVEPTKVLEIQAEIEVPPSPRLELDVYNYDAGLILSGEELPVKIRVSNKGELDLQVEFSHRQATFFAGEKKITGPLKIGPGRSQEIIIRLSTDNRTGMLREYVLLKSNDPLRSTVSVYISGYIVSMEQLKELFQKYRHLLEKKELPLL